MYDYVTICLHYISYVKNAWGVRHEESTRGTRLKNGEQGKIFSREKEEETEDDFLTVIFTQYGG